ncbi:CYTH domain-containing protein [Aureitalea marina]|uniref:Adenylate cyclase n=1 Tax=Aureitalea marina TaxID=930804 RepID=A0A2S7KTW3_9FLAO|nr:CYTH domain-containing protein [Aureitalea marina]PQB06057.1 adenylate cyclase [Aureitalea marina]
MIEIERKFLVSSLNFKNEAVSRTFIAQGFLTTEPERTVRVRVKGEQGYLTVKGISNVSGTSRREWEFEIPKTEAMDLLGLCPSVLEKNRFEVPVGSHLYEVDEFLGANAGLVLAEIELESEEEVFQRPNWLGKEVTGDVRYYNSQLSLSPYSEWGQTS